MSEITELRQKNDKMFVLVCLNFVMLFVLFCAMGYAIWRSIQLVEHVNDQLQKVEQGVVVLRSRIQEMDSEVVMDKVMDSAIKKIELSLSSSLKGVDMATPISNLSSKIEIAQEKLETTSERIQTVSQSLEKFDTDELAQQVSYHLLKGLGEGFTQAAESRKQ